MIVKNKITCLACNKTMISEHRHDYKTCDCSNKTMVDGGRDYVRYGGVDLSLVKVETEFLPEDFLEQRKITTWGTYGKNGDQPLKRVPICEMTNEHIQAVLGNCNPALYIKKVMTRELEYRKEENIYLFD